METPRKGKDSQKGALYVNSERLEKREMQNLFLSLFSPEEHSLLPFFNLAPGRVKGEEGGRPLYGVGGGSLRRQTQKTSAEINEMFRLSRKMNSFGCSSPVM